MSTRRDPERHAWWVVACALAIAGLAGWLWLLPGHDDQAEVRRVIETQYQDCLYRVALNTDVTDEVSTWLANRCETQRDQALAANGLGRP